jgi:crossover junction endodeoxyribonuclease RusA
MIEITLPYPPSVNCYKTVGRTITTKRGKIYQARVNSEATKRFYFETWMLVRQKGFKSLGDALISFEVDVYPPDKRRRDLDNILKVTLDALQKANVYDDDSQISRLVVQRRDMIDQGKLIVRIKPYVNVTGTESKES